jgi:hypothetical protein
VKSLLTDPIDAEVIPARTLLGLGPRNRGHRQPPPAPARAASRPRVAAPVHGHGHGARRGFYHDPQRAAPRGRRLARRRRCSSASGRTASFASCPSATPSFPASPNIGCAPATRSIRPYSGARPFWLQGLTPSLDHVLSMWTIAVLMMVTLSIVAHSVPLACALFIAPVTLSAAVALVRAGAPQLGRRRARRGAAALRLLRPLRAKPYPLPPRRRGAARKDRDRQPAAARIRGNLGRLAVADRQQPPPRPRLAAPGLCARRAPPKRLEGVPLLQALVGRRLGNRPVPQEPARHGRTDEAARKLLEPDRPGHHRRRAALVGTLRLAAPRRGRQVSSAFAASVRTSPKSARPPNRSPRWPASTISPACPIASASTRTSRAR